jgi:predicted DNA-binding transcriptional regulator AlpA
MTSEADTPPPLASAPLADWISWALATMRFDPGVNVALRRPDVETFTGLGRTAIDTMVAEREFPAPFKLSDRGRAIAWHYPEVLAWKLQRLAIRDEMSSREARDYMEVVRGPRARRKA